MMSVYICKEELCKKSYDVLYLAPKNAEWKWSVECEQQMM